MEEANDGPASWLLAFTGGPVTLAHDFHPLVKEWRDISSREARLGIPPGRPILLSPDLVDYRIGDYFRNCYPADRSSTAETYALELRSWFTFLRKHDVEWFEASHFHVRSYQTWRVYDEQNPRPVSAATWNKGWAALRHFYRWALGEGWIDRDPVQESDRLLDPGTAGGNREKNARSSRDRWITPREYWMWRDVGLRGYDAEVDHLGRVVAGLPRKAARCRNIARNTAFVDYLAVTGLRLQEAATLLTLELPSQVHEEVPIVGKRRVRRHYRVIHEFGLVTLQQYLVGERRDALRRAWRKRRYEQIDGRLDVHGVTKTRSGQRIRLINGRSVMAEQLSARERAKLYLANDGQLEPAWLWLKEDGIPLLPPSLDKVFDAANDRVTSARTLLNQASPQVKLTAHSLRFSFALVVLLASIRAIDEHMGLDASSPFLLQNYNQAFDEVRDLLGHASTETTRNTYLEPLKGLRRSNLLRGASLNDVWDTLVAGSPLVGFG